MIESIGRCKGDFEVVRSSGKPVRRCYLVIDGEGAGRAFLASGSRGCRGDDSAIDLEPHHLEASVELLSLSADGVHQVLSLGEIDGCLGRTLLFGRVFATGANVGIFNIERKFEAVLGDSPAVSIGVADASKCRDIPVDAAERLNCGNRDILIVGIGVDIIESGEGKLRGRFGIGRSKGAVLKPLGNNRSAESSKVGNEDVHGATINSKIALRLSSGDRRVATGSAYDAEESHAVLERVNRSLEIALGGLFVAPGRLKYGLVQSTGTSCRRWRCRRWRLGGFGSGRLGGFGSGRLAGFGSGCLGGFGSGCLAGFGMRESLNCVVKTSQLEFHKLLVQTDARSKCLVEAIAVFDAFQEGGRRSLEGELGRTLKLERGEAIGTEGIAAVGSLGIGILAGDEVQSHQTFVVGAADRVVSADIRIPFGGGRERSVLVVRRGGFLDGSGVVFTLGELEGEKMARTIRRIDKLRASVGIERAR